MSGKKVLVIGSGGREHALCWKLSQSSKIERIFVLPGSFGIKQVNKVELLDNINPKDFEKIASWCRTSNIDLVIVGPEDPLANGIADKLNAAGIRCFGPGKTGAQIESDKKWAKDFMIRHNIPTARYNTFTDTKEAKEFLQSAPYNALVVKASGLAAGKGVIVASDINEASKAVDEILGDRKFGAAGDIVVIEELLVGEEISVLAFVDSYSVRLMLPAQDHKRLKDNDEGPNTGGMGAYCPCPLLTQQNLEKIKQDVLQRAVDGLRTEGINYCGVLYAGLMLTADGPRVLEFNCRFGDPETQVILPLLENDLYDVMSACCDNKLSGIQLNWKNNLFAVGVVMASAGYPETATKGCVISGIPVNNESQIIFHSAISVDSSGRSLTNGGRVLIAVALAKDLKYAASEATRICRNIEFYGSPAQYRTDIAHKAFKFLSLSYKDSGVDIDAGDDLVQRIKPLARGTFRKGVVGGIGGFGGLFSLNELSYKNPILCEVTKGVGIKIKIALDYELYESIGFDLVAMCVNDVLQSGAEPVAFLDYIACGKLQVPIAAQIIKGISEGCREANCALLGGETAEMPSVYAPGKYDIAGYSLGVLEEGHDLPKFNQYSEGDIIVALPSTGLHCSGIDIVYDLIQKFGINLNSPSEFSKNLTFGQEILKPSKIYVRHLLPLIHNGAIKAVSHISKGFLDGIERIVPENYEAIITATNLKLPKLYGWLAAKGELTDDTLLNNFNCGVGVVFVVSKSYKDWKNIPNAVAIGELRKRTTSQPVLLQNFKEAVDATVQDYCKDNISKRTYSIQSRDHTKVVQKVEEIIKETSRKETFLSQSGKQLTRVPKTFKDPILVIGTDGVGTKIKIAQQCNINTTVGIDLVAMCVNDILCNGAEPLTFLGYYACGDLTSNTAAFITSGIAEGCKQAGSSLIETELAEMPLLYRRNVYDLGGFALGITERVNMLPRINDIQEGDLVIGLPSSGVHSNGFSLIHKIMEYSGVTFDNRSPFSNLTFGEECLAPTKIYVEAIKPLLAKKCIKALAHITGGGLLENIPRVLPKDLGVQLDANKMNIPSIFGWLAENGNITDLEMQRTYNCGVGLVLVVDPTYRNFIMEHLHLSQKATEIGYVCKRQSLNTPQVLVDNFNKCLARVRRTVKTPKKRVAVLISGSGTNLQALIDASRDSAQSMGGKIVLVISNKANVLGLARAKVAGIPGIFISHREFPSREDFDNAISEKLMEYNVDVICLAGFMRILSKNFVRQWRGRLLNIHPSLLPKYPGLNVQQKAIDAGETESGCTVHFVDEGVDTGAIIVQEKVPILPGDDAEKLSQRIHKAEYYAFPLALKLVCTGVAVLNDDGKVTFNY